VIPIKILQAKGISMNIESLMVHDPITVTVHARIEEALELMKINSIRHLPVVDSKKCLMGLLTLADLKQALLPSMLGDLTLQDMMIKKPMTVAPHDDIEIAAKLIYHYKISGLPVIHGNRLVGIITDSDILHAFIEMMGILTDSARIDLTTGQDPADLNRAIQIIHAQGGDIINVGLTTQQTADRTYHFRLASCDTEPITDALESAGFQVQATMR
jgi:acetoin utilization protein AcuB